MVAITGALLSLIVARVVVTPPRRRSTDIRVLALDPSAGTVTLSSTADSRLPGEYSYFFEGDAGAARIGEIIALRADSVVRRVIDVTAGELVIDARGRFSGWYYLDPGELGYPFENIRLDTELGPAPAWLVPAETGSERWVIQVHGRAVRRQETIRAVPVFREAGYSSLLISYRNDGDAPSSADRRYALGDTEWRDVDVALEYAIAHGAKDIVLMGWSMGGATVLQELTRSAHAGVVRGVVLDSPVIDWVTALRFQGQLRHLPEPVSEGALSIIGTNWGRRLTGQGVAIDLPRLDFVARAAELHVPILLMHSDDDGYVPITASRALAAARPDIVTLEAFSVAAHTKLWNFDRVRWNSAISGWLAELPSTARS
jgi:pimeloyl-ACP methyl ester carboxylesterase